MRLDRAVMEIASGRLAPEDRRRVDEAVAEELEVFRGIREYRPPRSAWVASVGPPDAAGNRVRVEWRRP